MIERFLTHTLTHTLFMSQLTRTAYKNLYGTSGTTFPDNTTGQISEGDLRTFGEDSSDSFLTRRDDIYNNTFPMVQTTGTNTYAGSPPFTITSYTNLSRFYVKFTNASTGASTLNLSSVGAKKIYVNPTTQADSGDIVDEQTYILLYDDALDGAAGGFLMIGSAGGGGATQDLQSVLDEGSTANIGDSQAAITAEDASNYSQLNITPSTFELANSNIANTAGSTLSVDTDGAHVNDTRANRGLQGGADYSANIQANDYTQKVYVDAKVADAITNGVTDVAPSQNAVFDALALKADTSAIPPKVVQLAASDETTAITTGTAKITFRMPYAMTLTAIRASLSTAQTSGSTFTVDVNEGGTTILSTKLTIDNTEKTSTTAATPPVISDASLSDDAEITIDVDQIGDGTAKGLKVTLIGL